MWTEQIQVIKKGRKPRVVHKGSPVVKSMARLLRKELRSFVEPRLRNNRYRQSREMIEDLEAYHYACFVDMKKCYDSCSVDKFCRYFQVELSEENLIPLIKAIYFCEIKGAGEKRLGYLRAGVSTSDVIIQMILTPVFKEADRLGVKFGAFVDDVFMLAHNRAVIEQFYKFFVEHLAKFDLSVHQEIGKKNSGVLDLSKDGKCGERLGLMFRKKEGKVLTRLRPNTVKRYLMKVRLAVRRSLNYQHCLSLNQRICYGEYGLFTRTYPRQLWNDEIQRKVVEAKIYNIINKRYWHQSRV